MYQGHLVELLRWSVCFVNHHKDKWGQIILVSLFFVGRITKIDLNI